jgi:hypothetical protein
MQLKKKQWLKKKLKKKKKEKIIQMNSNLLEML